MTKLSRRAVLAAALAAAIGSAMPIEAASAGDMRIAFGDLPGIESIQTLAAIERAKERGVNVELIILNDEDLAAQAIVGGQADVGIGTPYTLIQKVGRADPPVRADFDAALLPGRQRRILQDLEGSRRTGHGGAGARLRHRGGDAADGQEPRHHAWQHQLCSGFGGAPQCAAPGNDQGIDRRRRQPARARGGGTGQVHRAAGRESERHRRRRCSPPRTTSRTTPPMSTSSSRS